MKVEEKYMRRCLQLAQNGLGKTYPNPLVGCVIVYKNQIIGEGWHQKAGAAHAEVNAINAVEDKSKLKEATLYVSLEPCSHFGKTPPCSDLIIKHKIKNVVVGSVDPNPEVAGNGIKKLKQFCNHVKVGFLEEECKKLNKRFFTFQTEKRPYVILKWAETQDGFIAPKTQKIGKPIWITNPYSKQLVHKWRSEEQAILVGLNTALKDNPQLNTRLWKGESPVRVLIDKDLKSLKSLKSSISLHLLNQKIKTIVFCENPIENKENLIFEKINFHENTIPQILEVLYQHNLQTLIVEGGQKTSTAFLEANLWDEARVFIGKSYFKEGIKSPDFPSRKFEKTFIQQDELRFYQRK